jgi:N utilization substance protein B
MRKRTQAREFALQVLYELDVTGNQPEEALDMFWGSNSDKEIDEQIKLFTGELVTGVRKQRGVIDECICRHAMNWQLERMAVVDRNILRLGSFELIFREDIPPKVTINESVELAKKFYSFEAAKFVNGILDSIRQEKKR